MIRNGRQSTGHDETTAAAGDRVRRVSAVVLLTSLLLLLTGGPAWADGPTTVIDT